MSKQIHLMLVNLHKVCKSNAKFHNYKMPNINTKYRSNEKMKNEFDKLLYWIKFPYYGHFLKK